MIALLDTLFCVAVAMFTLYLLISRCHILTNKQTSIAQAMAMMLGVIGWITFAILAAATIIDLGLQPTWQVRHGYAISRFLIGVAWVLMIIDCTKKTN